MTERYALIEGSGFELADTTGQQVETPYGEPSAPIRSVRRGAHDVLWLPRHGDQHTIPPHRINYRANLYALREAGATSVIGINTVGVITGLVAPGGIAVPRQLIDYTWGRAHTYFDGDGSDVRHVEFSDPLTATLADGLVAAAAAAGVDCTDGGVYAVTQGPRLETAAEIDRLERDGADLVGMTAMPEAVLAAELGLGYAIVALAVNPAAGRTEESLHAEVERNAASARRRCDRALDAFFGSAV